MTQHHVVVVDDLAADRTLTARALKRAGWQVQAVATSTAAYTMMRNAQLGMGDPITLIVTDLHMPHDPNQRTTPQLGEAGSQFALAARTAMERGEIATMPIVAVTALTAAEVHLTALAFGCDLVLTKPATSALPQQILDGLAQAETQDLAGTTAMLHLLRHRLAGYVQPDSRGAVTEPEVTRALLAYHRQGLVGLGMSQLAGILVSHLPPGLQRGEVVHHELMEALRQIMGMNQTEATAILHRELLHQATPAEQCAMLHLSLGEYYKRRRTAIKVLVEWLATRPQ